MSVIARLDALANATGLKADDVVRIAEQHRGARGLRHLETALELMDAGAQSPKETWLRLTVMEAGYPRPQTQIPVLDADGVPFAHLDLGWEEWMLALEYEGDHHRGPLQFGSDIHRLEKVQHRGWHVIRVVASDRRRDVLRRLEQAVTMLGIDRTLGTSSVR